MVEGGLGSENRLASFKGSRRDGDDFSVADTYLAHLRSLSLQAMLLFSR